MQPVGVEVHGVEIDRFRCTVDMDAIDAAAQCAPELLSETRKDGSGQHDICVVYIGGHTFQFFSQNRVVSKITGFEFEVAANGSLDAPS